MDIDDEFSMRSSVAIAWCGEESLDIELPVGIMVSLAMVGSWWRYGFYSERMCGRKRLERPKGVVSQRSPVRSTKRKTEDGTEAVDPYGTSGRTF